MAEVFMSKVRPVGSSLGVIIPNEIVVEENLEAGKEVQLSIVPRNFTLLDKLFGSAKNSRRFIRDRRDRI